MRMVISITGHALMGFELLILDVIDNDVTVKECVSISIQYWTINFETLFPSLAYFERKKVSEINYFSELEPDDNN